MGGRRCEQVPDSGEHFFHGQLPIQRWSAEQEQSTGPRKFLEEREVGVGYGSFGMGGDREGYPQHVRRIRNRIFRRRNDKVEVARRNAREAEVNGPRSAARTSAEFSHDWNATKARGDSEVRGLSLQLRARVRFDAAECRSEQGGRKPTQLIETEVLLLERPAERPGECEHLVIVPAMGAEERPNARRGWRRH